MRSKSMQYRVFVAACAVICALGMASNAGAWNPLIHGGRCASNGGSCNTTIGNAGGSGACCDPRSSNVASCVSSNKCQGGTVYKWPGPLTWSFNPNGLPAGFAGKTAAAYEASLKAAWDVWTTPTCTSFKHVYAGRTTTSASTKDRKVVAFFANSGQWAQFGFGSSTLAVTRPAIKADGSGEVIDADIIYNPNPSGRKWGIHPNVGAQEMDFQDVSAHEIGHALGFGHAHPRASLMYFSVRGIGPVFAGLPQDEKDAVCATYPGNNPPPECQTDADCTAKGACMACQAGKCVARSVTAEAKSCKGCRGNADCGDLACVNIGGKFRCLQPCSAGCCPSGTTCQTQSGQPLCVPTGDQCPVLSCTQESECGIGETCTAGTCQPKAAPPAEVCGDGTCQASKENCGNCAQDCACPSGETCQSNACAPTAPPVDDCGNGACDVAKGENCSTCSQDCSCPVGQMCQAGACGATSTNTCGDGQCGGSETCATCPQDCGCPTGSTCQAGTCAQDQTSQACSPTQACPAGQVCTNGLCVVGVGPTNPAPGAVGGPCLPGGTCLAGATCFAQPTGQTVCLQKANPPGIGNFRPSGFGCSLRPGATPSAPYWTWFLLPLLLFFRRQRS